MAPTTIIIDKKKTFLLIHILCLFNFFSSFLIFQVFSSRTKQKNFTLIGFLFFTTFDFCSALNRQATKKEVKEEEWLRDGFEVNPIYSLLIFTLTPFPSFAVSLHLSSKLFMLRFWLININSLRYKYFTVHLIFNGLLLISITRAIICLLGWVNSEYMWVRRAFLYNFLLAISPPDTELFSSYFFYSLFFVFQLFAIFTTFQIALTIQMHFYKKLVVDFIKKK